MHNRGRSEAMYARAEYGEVVAEVGAELAAAVALAEAAGVEITYVGCTGGRAIEDDDNPDDRAPRLRVPLDALRRAHEGFFPNLMGADAALA